MGLTPDGSPLLMRDIGREGMPWISTNHETRLSPVEVLIAIV